MKLICKVCKNEYNGHANSCYCSANCSKIGTREQRKIKNPSRQSFCKWCGKEFTGSKMYCTPECKSAARKNDYIHPKVAVNNDIVEACKKAAALGMSYGKYIAKYGK